MLRKYSAEDDILAEIQQKQQIILERLKEGTLDAAMVLESLQGIIEAIPLDFSFKDQRSAQAWKLYYAGWGAELDYGSFKDYLATVPPVPDWPAKWKKTFDRTVLVDARLPLRRMCELCGIDYLGDDDTWVDFIPEKARQGVYWMNCQAGDKKRGQNVRDCRKAFASFETGLSAVEGIALFLQERSILEDYFLVLPGSVLRRRGLVAFLRRGEKGPGLDWIPGGHAGPDFGIASRGE